MSEPELGFIGSHSSASESRILREWNLRTCFGGIFSSNSGLR